MQQFLLDGFLPTATGLCGMYFAHDGTRFNIGRMLELQWKRQWRTLIKTAPRAIAQLRRAILGFRLWTTGLDTSMLRLRLTTSNLGISAIGNAMAAGRRVYIVSYLVISIDSPGNIKKIATRIGATIWRHIVI